MGAAERMPRTALGDPSQFARWPRWRVVRNVSYWVALGPTYIGDPQTHPDDAIFTTHAEAIAYADHMARSNP